MPRVTAKELRDRYEWDVELEPGVTVRCRRVDMVNAHLQHLIPLPLLAALDRLKKRSDEGRLDPSTIMDVPPQDTEQTLELFRRYACAAAIDPLFAMPEPEPSETTPLCAQCGFPHARIAGDHAAITTLDAAQLLKIWLGGPKKKLPEVSRVVADAFRQSDAPSADPDAVSNGREVPGTTQPVSVGDIIESFQRG
jgi:hypothetical protein